MTKRASRKNLYKKQSVVNTRRIFFNIFILLCFIGTIYFLFTKSETLPTFNQSRINKEHIMITEIVSSKSNHYSNVFEEYYDWIEIHNPTDSAIKLKNYYLSDDTDYLQKYRLPDITIEPDQYIAIYASGRNIDIDGELHTNFKIGTKGEDIFLSYKTFNIQNIDLPINEDDFSYGIDVNGKWKFLNPTTPNVKNGHGFDSFEDYYNFELSPSGIYINEYMSKKQSVIYDEAGNYCDWIEIINLSGADVNLKGYYLSVDKYNPSKWTFPDYSLKDNAVCIVFADSKNISSGTQLHANFSLSTNDKALYLFNNQGILIDLVGIVETDETVSYGRNKDDMDFWEYFDMPTPGQTNILDGTGKKKR